MVTVVSVNYYIVITAYIYLKFSNKLQRGLISGNFY